MTTYILRSASPAKTKADAVVVGVVKSAKGPVLAAGGEDVAAAYGRKLAPLLATLGVTGKAGETAKVPTAGTLGTPLLVLVGLGAEEALTPDAVRRAAGAAARSVPNAATVALALPATEPALVAAVTEGHVLGGYTFDRYRKDSKAEAKDAPEVIVLTPTARQKETVAAFERAQLVAAATAQVRDWVNTPANDLFPASLASAMVESLPEGVTAEVWDEQRLREERCGGVLAVGGGSAHAPRMVRLSWEPAGATRHVALVGKGITFDTGGYWIKPSSSMTTMKSDMAGAATVVAAIATIARLGLPVRVTAWAPLAENMISGAAMRPGDVMTARNGTTVEIVNTDAEGRLVLCDALALAAEEEPDAIVDIATLTGAMVMALGDKIAGLIGDDEVVADLTAASELAGEPVWRMPIPEEMAQRVRSSKIADLAHYDGVRWGGGLFAAAYLREFVDGRPWAHLDIAGPSWASGGPAGHVTTGGTGFGVSTLVEYVAALA
ncbi:putative cytosol aminopeptidase [Nocardioides phosphati]|uniref:Probable cytosol aminopeptidase n=1 Tax=Nocardioides phosphati TaxID=1867775 RepID=A0ABQ2NEL7_9ACTN|nr:leucyl aminopeptidase [Nocardioides phosphati]GGO92976.1 putative cytosol aminopeptidase [Nocardioides phosphati]